MKYKCYSKVKVITDKYKKDGVPSGALGIILEVYDEENYEVQFLDKNNEPSNIFFAVNKYDIVPENDN